MDVFLRFSPLERTNVKLRIISKDTENKMLVEIAR